MRPRRTRRRAEPTEHPVHAKEVTSGTAADQWMADAAERMEPLVVGRGGRPLPPAVPARVGAWTTVGARAGSNLEHVRARTGPAAARSATAHASLVPSSPGATVHRQALSEEELLRVTQQPSISAAPPAQQPAASEDGGPMSEVMGALGLANFARLTTDVMPPGMASLVGGAAGVAGIGSGLMNMFGSDSSPATRGKGALQGFAGASTLLGTTGTAIGAAGAQGAGGAGIGAALGAFGEGGLLATMSAVGESTMGSLAAAAGAETAGGITAAGVAGTAGALTASGLAGYGVGSLLAEHTGVDEALGDAMFEAAGPAPDWLIEASDAVFGPG